MLLLKNDCGWADGQQSDRFTLVQGAVEPKKGSSGFVWVSVGGGVQTLILIFLDQWF